MRFLLTSVEVGSLFKKGATISAAMGGCQAEIVHPIVPVMLYDVKLAQEFAARMLIEGIYVIGFYYPVVPKEKVRIRVEISAAHEQEHLDKAIAAFIKVGTELAVL